MKLRLITLACSSVATLCVAASQSHDFCGAPPRLVHQFGLTFRQALDQAYARKERGLATLFRMSTSPQLDGEWAECYATEMQKLLDVWGDKRFAAVLRKQSSSVRKAEWRVLRDIALMKFSGRYPEVFAASYP